MIINVLYAWALYVYIEEPNLSSSPEKNVRFINYEEIFDCLRICNCKMIIWNIK